MKNRYQVIVGNIGTIYDGNNMIDANRAYGNYKQQSISNFGRAGGEPVTMMDNGEIKYEYVLEWRKDELSDLEYFPFDENFPSEEDLQ